MSVSFKIKIFDNTGTHVLQVSKSTLTIGGAAHCDVVIHHPSVQSEHTRAWLEGGRIWVQDLGSPSGTALNDIRLPALKPMLVRDLDVLRLGQSESTLGLEAVLVRAPVVKAKAPAERASLNRGDKEGAETKNVPRDLEAEQRREQVEILARELADLRLHLQMTKLEKRSNEEMAQQLQNLRSETKNVQEQKTKWDESFRKMEAEKATMKKTFETEMAEFKTKSVAELQAQREKDLRKLETWKKDAAAELTKSMHTIAVQKVRSWATRPLSQVMFTQLEADITHLFRKVLLNDTSPAPVHPELPPIAPVAAPSPAPVLATVHPVVPALTIDMTEGENTATDVKQSIADQETRVHIARSRPNISDDETRVHSAQPKPHKKRRSPPPAAGFKLPPRKQIIVTSVVVVLVSAVLWLGTSYLRSHSARSLSSQTPPTPAHKASDHFEPKQSRKYRNSYTDNVLYLENYLAAEENQDFRRLWSTELNRTVLQEWKLDKGVAAPILSKEQFLVQDLGHIRDSLTKEREQEGINQMRSREAIFLKDLEALLKNRAAVERFLKYKRAFYTRNQAYLTAN